MRMRVFLWTVLTVACAAASPVTIIVECDHPDAVYRTGEEVVFSLTALDGRGAKVGEGRFRAGLDNFGPVEIVPRRDYDFAKSNPVIIRGRMSEPGFLRLGMNMPGVTNIVWSVAVSPERIRPGAPCPKDFDAFWSRAIARYDAEIEEDVELAPQPALSTPELDVFKVALSAIGGRRIYGILSRPKDLSKGPFPLRFGGKGAGPSSFGRCGRPGRVTLEMNVHFYDAPVGSSKKDNAERQKCENDEWVKRYPARHAEYQLLGIAASREEYFYYGVILATRRAFKWLARQPYADRRDVAYSSTSQGGAFGLYMTALCPEIRRLVACVPAMTDLCGFRAARMSGWPRLIEAQLDDRKTAAEANAPYFDAANFARRVKCPVRFVVGFSDTTCPPSAVYAAYNNLASSDKAIIHGIGMTHLVRKEYYDELDVWLERQLEGDR